MRNIDQHSPDINAIPAAAYGNGEFLIRQLMQLVARRNEWPAALRAMTALEVADEFALLAALAHELQHSQHWMAFLLCPCLDELIAAVQAEAAQRRLTLFAGADPSFLVVAKDMAAEITNERC